MSKKVIAIVTGASSGFGKEFVKLMMDEELSEIWAIARNQEKLDKLAEEFGEKIRTFSMDLSDRINYEKLEEQLKAEGVIIKYLVNNAGFVKFASFEDISVSETLNMIDLNVASVVALGLKCISFMEKGSRIINIASQSAFFPLPYMNVYSATKVFVRNYTRALNVELKDKGITATAVCPGWMKTALFERGNVGAKKAVNNFFGMVTPEVVAKKAFKDAKKGKDISVYGLYNKSTHFLSKIMPQRMMMKVWCTQQKFK